MNGSDKQIRTLERKLARSERHRAELEELRDKDQALYKKMHAEIDAARETIARAHAELERRNEEILAQRDELKQALRDLKATQAQLIQSEKMASLGQLTAGIAHEIKNPLNFVTNFAGVTEELVDELRTAQRAGDLDETEALLAMIGTNVAKIREHGERADGIVRSMMQHARGGTDRRERVDLNALVDEYASLAYHGMRASTPGFDVELIRDLGRAVGRVDVFPQDLGRVLLNLIGNAFDAVHERASAGEPAYGPRVRLSTRRRGEHVEIRVEDNGPGIAPDVARRVFEPFFTTKPTGQGTGLGLSLSYDIVTQGHGGTLDVEPSADGGAALVLCLPAVPDVVAR